jgi:hypothetical protein
MDWTIKVDAECKVNKERSVGIAKGMLRKNIDIETIIELTGLKREETNRWKNPERVQGLQQGFHLRSIKSALAGKSARLKTNRESGMFWLVFMLSML